VDVLFVFSLFTAILIAVGEWRTDRLPRFATRPLTELAEGKSGAIEGVVVANLPLRRAPISGTPCVYWQLVFHEVGAKDYVERGRAQEAGEFLVETPEGTARVVVDRARLGARPHRTEYRDEYAGGSNRDLVIAQARAVGVVFNHAGSRLRVIEYIVAPAQRVRIRGHCTREPDPTAVADVSGYREALPTRPVLSGTRRAPLLIATTR
jgi:hypothetical protein